MAGDLLKKCLDNNKVLLFKINLQLSWSRHRLGINCMVVFFLTI